MRADGGNKVNDLASSRAKITELKAKVKRLASKERYTEALATLHEIDDIEAHISVLRNTSIDKKCVREYSIPRGIQLIN